MRQTLFLRMNLFVVLFKLDLFKIKKNSNILVNKMNLATEF